MVREISDWAKPGGDPVLDGPVSRAFGVDVVLLTIDLNVARRMPGEWQARLVRLLDQAPGVRGPLQDKEMIGEGP
jgi:hypothetical protein